MNFLPTSDDKTLIKLARPTSVPCVVQPLRRLELLTATSSSSHAHGKKKSRHKTEDENYIGAKIYADYILKRKKSLHRIFATKKKKKES